MIRLEARMIEIIRFVVCHPEPPHHHLRSQVDGGGHRDYLAMP
jgi:hypothetical protein